MFNSNFNALAETYLKSNAKGRQNGALKADTHEKLCRLFVAKYFSIEPDKADELNIMVNGEKESSIIDTIRSVSRELTDHLDEKIDFPLDMAPNYRKLTPKFITEFNALCSDALLDDVRIMTDAELITLLNEVSKNKIIMVFHTLESYGFQFVEGNVNEKSNEGYLVMCSALDQVVTVRSNKFFGCRYTLKGLSKEYDSENEKKKE
jgi:hypothetical protein